MSILEEYNEAERNALELLRKLAEMVSLVTRSVEDKEDRVKAIKNLNLSNENLSKIYAAGLEKEDFETCEVIKEILESRGIKI